MSNKKFKYLAYGVGIKPTKKKPITIKVLIRKMNRKLYGV